MNSKRNKWLIGICAALLASCNKPVESTSSSGQQPDNSLVQVISGEVWYRERIALPPGTTIKVMLEDQSRMDVAATVITDYTHTVDEAQGPFPFRLVYDPAAIDERMRYGLRARIEHDGKLLLINTEHIDPFVDGPVRILVSKAGGEPAE